MTTLQIINAIPNMDPEARQRLRENANRWLNASPRQADEARQVLTALHEVAERERSRTSRRLSRTDTVARIVQAFRDPPMSETERRVVQVLIDNPDQSSEFLTAQCGWACAKIDLRRRKMKRAAVIASSAPAFGRPR